MFRCVYVFILFCISSLVYAKPDGLEMLVSQKVESIEVNHVYDEYAVYIMTQLIVRDYNNQTKQLEIVGWLLVSDCLENMTSEEYDRRNVKFKQEWYQKYKKDIKYNRPIIGSNKFIPIQRDKYTVIRFVDRQGWMREIICKSYFETWTQYDREVFESNKFPKIKRYGFLLNEYDFLNRLDTIKRGDTTPNDDTIHINIPLPF